MPSPVLLNHKEVSALVVENEAETRVLLAGILMGLGFRVTESADDAEAARVIQNKPCLDLLVTGSAPGIDGRMLVETFMLRCPLGRALLLTSEDDASSINIETTGAWLFIPRTRIRESLASAITGVGLRYPQRVILLAEDDPLVRNIVQAILIQGGHAVMSAADGKEALELSRAYSGRIDLLISDIEMPHLDGHAAAAHIREERPEIRILMMSGGASRSLTRYSAPQPFLEKPFLPKKLLDKIAEVLENAEGALEFPNN